MRSWSIVIMVAHFLYFDGKEIQNAHGTNSPNSEDARLRFPVSLISNGSSSEAREINEISKSDQTFSYYFCTRCIILLYNY